MVRGHFIFPSRARGLISCSRYHFKCLGLGERDAEDIRKSFTYITACGNLISVLCVCLELFVCPSCHEKTGLHTVSEYYRFSPRPFSLRPVGCHVGPPPFRHVLLAISCRKHVPSHCSCRCAPRSRAAEHYLSLSLAVPGVSVRASKPTTRFWSCRKILVS
jgi:hypothetical protein